MSVRSDLDLDPSTTPALKQFPALTFGWTLVKTDLSGTFVQGHPVVMCARFQPRFATGVPAVTYARLLVRHS